MEALARVCKLAVADIALRCISFMLFSVDLYFLLGIEFATMKQITPQCCANLYCYELAA